MDEAERKDWKAKLEATFRLPESDERYRVLDEQTDELWEIGPIIVRPKNSQNCSGGCCDLDQWVMEEYASHHVAYWAARFGGNAFIPIWRVILDVEI